MAPRAATRIIWFFNLSLLNVMSSEFAANGGIHGSLIGISISVGVSSTQKDTIKAPPPSEAKVMKSATRLSVVMTMVFYMLCGCMGYALPNNLLTGFGFYESFWLLDVANVAIVVHLVGAYQVFVQPIFVFVKRWASCRLSDSAFIAKELRAGPFALGCCGNWNSVAHLGRSSRWKLGSSWTHCGPAKLGSPTCRTAACWGGGVWAADRWAKRASHWGCVREKILTISSL
uniref:Amino acid transporter transmembrane domain-containing protein n=1 Tax=Oryza glumipatula TaxID=40148 RepID=A0A0E0AVB6_9ORYZ